MAMQKRKSTGVSQPGGSAQASEASRDSGVSQPADNEGSRILLVDAGWIKARIAQHLVRDQRNPVEVDDIIQTTEQLNADEIVGTQYSRATLNSSPTNVVESSRQPACALARRTRPSTCVATS